VLTVTLGAALTCTVTLALAWHPFTLMPTTEYVVVTVALTEIEAEVAPVLQVTPVAPETVSVVDAPEQITDGEALIDNVGNGITVIIVDAFAVHPPELVPVTL